MTKLEYLISGREGLEQQLHVREQLVEMSGDARDVNAAEHLRACINSLRWAEKIVRAALVIAEERTPEGVSETLIDELVKACR